MIENTCCFWGHRKIKVSNELRIKLYNTIERLIVYNSIDTFLFGSKSQFDELCHQITSELKSHYPHIKRIYVRAQFPYITNEYKEYLLKSYEETYYPPQIIKSGKAAYVERNFEMINKSKFCIVYFDNEYLPPMRKKGNDDLANYQPKSGTRIAYDYAVKMKKIIINLFSEPT